MACNLFICISNKPVVEYTEKGAILNQTNQKFIIKHISMLFFSIYIQFDLDTNFIGTVYNISCLICEVNKGFVLSQLLHCHNKYKIKCSLSLSLSFTLFHSLSHSLSCYLLCSLSRFLSLSLSLFLTLSRLLINFFNANVL